MSDVRIINESGTVTRPATTAEVAEAAARESQIIADHLLNWRATVTLSRFEMGEALIGSTILAEEQAEDFLRGVIPAPLEGLIALLPEADRPLARRLTIGARDFARSDTLWLGIANAPTGPSAEDIDAIFGWVAP